MSRTSPAVLGTALDDAPADRPRVLVVDDFVEVRDMLVDGLTRAGFAAEGAASVPQALGMPLEDFGALVVDQRLNGELGTGMFRVLCERDAAFASRFILMTADTHAVELPAGVPVLLKPFRIDALVNAVWAVLTGPDGTGEPLGHPEHS